MTATRLLRLREPALKSPFRSPLYSSPAATLHVGSGLHAPSLPVGAGGGGRYPGGRLSWETSTSSYSRGRHLHGPETSVLFHRGFLRLSPSSAVEAVFLRSAFSLRQESQPEFLGPLPCSTPYIDLSGSPAGKKAQRDLEASKPVTIQSLNCSHFVVKDDFAAKTLSKCKC